MVRLSIFGLTIFFFMAGRHFILWMLVYLTVLLLWTFKLSPISCDPKQRVLLFIIYETLSNRFSFLFLEVVSVDSLDLY